MKYFLLILFFLLISSAQAITAGPGLEIEPVQVAQSGTVEESQAQAVAAQNAQFPAAQEPEPTNGSVVDSKGFTQPITVNQVNDAKSLDEFLVGLKKQEPQIHDLDFDGERLSLKYPFKVKLFVFIPITARIETQAKLSQRARIKVMYPWWIVLTTADTYDIQVGIEDELNNHMNSYEDTVEGEQLTARLALAMVQASKVSANS